MYNVVLWIARASPFSTTDILYILVISSFPDPGNQTWIILLFESLSKISHLSGITEQFSWWIIAHIYDILKIIHLFTHV